MFTKRTVQCMPLNGSWLQRCSWLSEQSAGGSTSKPRAWNVGGWPPYATDLQCRHHVCYAISTEAHMQQDVGVLHSLRPQKQTCCTKVRQTLAIACVHAPSADETTYAKSLSTTLHRRNSQSCITASDVKYV